MRKSVIPILFVVGACNASGDQAANIDNKNQPVTVIDSTNLRANPGNVVPIASQGNNAQQIQTLQSAAQQAGQGQQQSQIVTPANGGLTYTNGQGKTITEAEYKQLMAQQAAAQKGQQIVQTQQIAKGMNPPHGQPGHRCDIGVGQPLNSKPAPKATANATTLTAPAQIVQPVATKTAPGMNPPHGQPGHKCEIAVGAPLDSKPTTPTTTLSTAPPALDTTKH